MSDSGLQELFEKFMSGQISREEIIQLKNYIQDDANSALLDKLLESVYTNKSFRVEGDYNPDEVFEEILLKTAAVHKTGKSRTGLFRRRGWMAAASLLLIAGVYTYLFLNNTTQQPATIAKVKARPENDARPGSNRAILMLADGSTITLDSAANGTLASQGAVKILKLANGQITYTRPGRAGKELFYNTMKVPRGGQYSLILPDGSKVWLNAESSITYPTEFNGKERSVSITGEAYFEIAKNIKSPFLVMVNEMRVEVLGTHFNINSYKNEPYISTTLLEGSVRVTEGSSTALLKPDQQARLNTNGLIVENNVDVKQVVAWKDGLFSFHTSSLESVMHQLARWYDVEVVYEKHIPKLEIWGEMQRDLNLSDVLEILDKMDVHFRIEGKKLIVTP